MSMNTSVSAPRQKNCNSCVQAKRRCDRRTPTCSRCAEKTIPCLYTKAKIHSRPGRHGGASDISASSPSLVYPDNPFIPSSFSFDVDYFDSMTKELLPGFANYPQNELSPSANVDEEACVDPFLDSLPGIHGSSSTTGWLMRTESDTEHVLRSQNNRLGVRNSGRLVGCDNIEPWHIYDPRTTLHFVLNRVKGFVSDLGTKNALPFLHRYLYQSYMPQCIVSCFATCVLYANRTSVNTAMMMQALYSNVGSLTGANADKVASTPIEKLARVQALLLYQIIRLFDGDVALRSHAEKDTQLLIAWVDELCNIRDNLGDAAVPEDAPSKNPQTTDWERWIYAESVRRTIVMMFSVIGLYQVLKGREHIDRVPWSQIHRWTLSRSLWEARSASEFQRVWRENSHHVVDNFGLDRVFDSLKVDEVDEFAEIFLAVYMGAEATREFMSVR